MVIILTAIFFILIIEMASRSRPVQLKKSRILKNPNYKLTFKSWYLCLFLCAAASSLLAIWLYIVNATLEVGGPNYLFGWYLGIPMCLILFGIMAHAARIVILSLSVTQKQMLSLVIVAIFTLLLSINAVVATYQYSLNGRWYI